jgi:hypothetical protein
MTEHGNRMYLVCTHCGAEIEHTIMLGQRRTGAFSKSPRQHHLEEWFEAHAHDGGDHFKLAFGKTPDWDRSMSADPVHLAVKLALVQ